MEMRRPQKGQSAPSMEQLRPLAAPATGIPRKAQPGSTYSHSWTCGLLGSQRGPRAQPGQAAPGRCGYSPGQGLGPGKRLWAPLGVLPKPRAPSIRWPSQDTIPTAMLVVGRPKEHPDSSASRTPTQRLGSQSQSCGGRMLRTAQGSARSLGGYGMRVWGSLGEPQDRIWLDLGKDRRAAR